MGLVGHVALMGEGDAYTWFWWGKLRERVHVDVAGMDGKVILKWIFK